MFRDRYGFVKVRAKGFAHCTWEEFEESFEDYKPLWIHWNRMGRLKDLLPTLFRLDPKGGWGIKNLSWGIYCDHRKICGQSTKRPGFLGVQPVGKRFRAYVICDGVSHYVGTFDTEEEAGRARDRKARQLFGPLAVLNFKN